MRKILRVDGSVPVMEMNSTLTLSDFATCMVDADSYNKWSVSCLPEKFRKIDPMRGNELNPHMEGQQWIRAGDSAFSRVVLRGGRPIVVYVGGRKCYAMFTGDAYIPRLTINGNVWMSLTPMEIASQQSGIRFANGNVMIGGLGMGWMAQACLEKTSVTSITVVEQNEQVINLFGEFLKNKTHKPVNIIHGDAYDYAKTHADDHDRFLFDIWESYGESYEDDEFAEVKLMCRKVWGWGDVKDLPF